ncbi:hypothetical protein KFU94_31405 [Chloroflexi bacterium TSY]|nr:hypothetical protein [Chloroflexi bacterium TSY]
MPFSTRIAAVSYILAMISGLLSDVMAGYLAPAFEQRRWLAVGLFLFCIVFGLLLMFYQERKTYRSTKHLLTLIDPALFRQLRTILRNVPEFDIVRDRRTVLLQVALPNGSGIDERIDHLPSVDPNSGNDLYQDLYHHIEFEGSKERFIINLLNTLLQEKWFDEGKEYLQSLLMLIGEQSGIDVQEEIEGLLPAIDTLSPTPIKIPNSAHRVFARLQLYDTPRLRTYLIAVPVLVLLVLFLGPLISDVWAQNAPTCPPDRTCILVANFMPEESQVAKDVTDAVEQEVRTIINASGGKRFTIKRVDAVKDDVEARNLAREQKALLIIWGDVKESIQQLTIDFELTELLSAGESTDVRDFRIEPQGYSPVDQTIKCSGCIHTQISQNVSRPARIIGYTAMGLLHYVQGWPEQARLDFAAALYCAGEPVSVDLMTVQQPLCEPDSTSSEANHGLLYYYLGRSSEFSGDYAGAIKYLEHANLLNPDDPATLVGMGLVYQRWLGDPDVPQATAFFRKAMTRANQLMASAPETEKADIFYLQGIIHELLREYEAAQHRYEAAIRSFQLASSLIGSDHVSTYNALVALGRVQRANNQPAKALRTLNRAVALRADAPWAYLELAHLHRDSPRKARNWLNKAVRRAPTAAHVHLTRAELCTEWGLLDCAKDAYTIALQRRPGAGWVQRQVGIFYWHHDQYLEKGVAYYGQALERRPCDPWMHDRMAFALGKTGQHEAAATHYRQALRLTHPETPQHLLAQLRKGLRVALKEAEGPIPDLSSPPCGEHSLTP